MITKRGQTGRHRCPAASVVEHTNMNKLQTADLEIKVFCIWQHKFSDMKVWALRAMAAIALIVIGTICLPKIWSQLKNSFSEISTARKRNPRRGKMQGRVKVWQKEILNVKNLHPYSRNGYQDWKRFVLDCDQNTNVDNCQACRQMNDTTRVDQRPRKWSVNPQHKLVSTFSYIYKI